MRTLRAILSSSLATALVVSGSFLASFLVGCASGQPHMRSALDHLFSARSELQAATTDKGGHRVRAIELINEAVSEVEHGMDYTLNH
jgi:hypothetical protein